MSDCDKTEKQLPKSTATGKKTLGNLRFQIYSDDKIHIHDDDKVFEYKNKRYFQAVMDAFIREAHNYPVGSIFFVLGDAVEKDKVRANLVLTREELKWTLTLTDKVVSEGTPLCDDVLSFIDDFIQES